MFKRKKTYPDVVAEARFQAKETGDRTIVYQEGKTYNWCFIGNYSDILVTAGEPVIKLLICAPNGSVAQ